MKDVSLDLALDIIINALNNSNIDLVDKVELMINLRMFLLDYKEEMKRRLYEKRKRNTF